MPTLNLQILKEDILNTVYTNFNECAITRALRRAGKLQWIDCGVFIQNTETNKMEIRQSECEDYRILCKKVVGMYLNKKLAKDFKFTLSY